jgi:hypothetical protein
MGQQNRMTYQLNHADTIPCIAPGEHDAQRQASNRAYAAMMLTQTPEAWFALLRGETIPFDQINMAEHNRTKRRMGAA